MKKFKPNPIIEAIIMLQTLEVCMKMRVLPRDGSGCHKRLKIIIRALKKMKSK